MAWVKLDDQARQHRKILAAGPVGAWLWVCGLMYCNSQKARDGFVPEAAVPVLYPVPGWRREAARLVSVGLWERVEGGYLVHDYHEYQPTAEEAERQRAQKALAGRAGGIRSGASRKADGQANSKHQAEADAKHAASLLPKPVPIPSRPDPVEDPPKPPKGGARTRGSRLPAGWVPSESVITWARAQGIADPLGPLDEFHDHWRQIGGARGTKLDWDAAYRNRLRTLIGDGRLLLVEPPRGSPRNAPDEGEVVPMPAKVANAFSVILDRMAGGST